jgi:PBSX family phage terminase large subunit
MKKKAKQSREDVISELWRRGELSWKLNKVQKELKNTVDNDDTKTSVVVVSRRTGKTYWLVIEALMQCIKHPNSVVKFLFPKSKDAKTNIIPIMRMITEDCPEDVKPIFNTQDKMFNFNNGSQIQLAGSDLGIDGIRGGFAHLCIVDEAGYCSELKYAIRSVLSPTIRTTGGRIIMASTPSKSPDHEFVTEYMIPYKASGRLKIFTIYDNPNFTPEIVQEIIEDYPRGVEDPDFKREYMCEVAIDTESAVCAEFALNKDEIVISYYEVPDHTDFYIGADIGYVDLTVMLFGYYDFKNATLVITDELVMSGATMTTEALALEIKKKEKLRFFKDGQNTEPYLRVMDNDLKLINDLRQLHNIQFMPTKKDNKAGAINEMKIWMGQGRIRIHERCKHLIYHLEYGQWNSKRTDFKRLNDSPDKTIKGGHVDAIPALYYLIRNIHAYRNPFPVGYGTNIGPNTYQSAKLKARRTSQTAETMRKIMNIGKKR